MAAGWRVPATPGVGTHSSMTLSTMWIGAAAAVHTRPTTVVSKSPALAVIFQVAGGPALRSNTFWQRRDHKSPRSGEISITVV
jgi:hypothetical protein